MCTENKVLTLSKEEILQLTPLDLEKYLAFILPKVKALLPTNPGNSRPVVTDAITFQKSIKKDKDAYPRLTKEEDFESWYREIHTTARLHDIAEVMDPTYIPVSMEDINTFRVKQNFAFSAFEKAIQHDVGKDLVRQFSDTADVQKLISELVKYQTT